MSTRGRKQTLTNSERKMNRSEVSSNSKWNKCRIYVDQLDRWNGLKEVLCVQTRAEVAKILLVDRQAEHVFSFFSQSFFIFYEFMMMPMIIFGRYYSIYVDKNIYICISKEIKLVSKKPTLIKPMSEFFSNIYKNMMMK